MRKLFASAIIAAAFSAALMSGAAAQKYSPETMTSCSQSVGQMKFDGWPSDRMREMAMGACLNNNGTTPGATSGQTQQPAALHVAPRAKHRAAPRG